MRPVFSTEPKRKAWRLAIEATEAEKDVLRFQPQFDLKVILHRKWKEYSDESERDETIAEVTTLGHFSKDWEPCAGACTFGYESLIETEEWEAQVKERLKHLTAEIAMFIEPTVPEIAERTWLSHCALIASTGGGKTNLCRWRLRTVIPQIGDGAATGWVMEPKGTLLESIWRLRAVQKIRDRVVIIDGDTPVSLNVFDRGDGSARSINATIDRLDRIFGIITTGLTHLQKVPLTMAVQAMYAATLPPNVTTLKHILRHGIDASLIGKLPEAVAEFFTEDFKPKARPDARAGELINRLNGVLANPTFAALFSGSEPTFDMFSEFQRGTLILINASSSAVGGSPELFGRIWIEEIARTMQPRLALPEEARTPVTCIIDEAQTYVSTDRSLADILDKAREARIGMLLAMHHMAQIEDARVRDSIYTNTVLKFVARTSADIHNLCRSMGTTEPDFINTLKQYEFAFFGPNMQTAMKVKLPVVDFAKMPHMTDEQYAEMRRVNREKYGYRRKPEEPTEQPQPSKPKDPSPVDVAEADTGKTNKW